MFWGASPSRLHPALQIIRKNLPCKQGITHALLFSVIAAIKGHLFNPKS